MIDVQFYKGTLQPIILKLLQDNGKMYGYEIISKIKILSNNQFEIKEGALYPILHKLETELPTKKWTNFLSPYAAILNLLIIN
ncbi:PadR family transcriptional regulator [Empedobacter falsenii]